MVYPLPLLARLYQNLSSGGRLVEVSQGYFVIKVFKKNGLSFLCHVRTPAGVNQKETVLTFALVPFCSSVHIHLLPPSWLIPAFWPHFPPRPPHRLFVSLCRGFSSCQLMVQCSEALRLRCPTLWFPSTDSRKEGTHPEHTVHVGLLNHWLHAHTSTLIFYMGGMDCCLVQASVGPSGRLIGSSLQPCVALRAAANQTHIFSNAVLDALSVSTSRFIASFAFSVTLNAGLWLGHCSSLSVIKY